MSVRPRDAYREIELYEPGRRPIDVDLSDNTNLFGVAPSVRELLNNLPDALVTRYPTVFARRLKEMLAVLHGVSPENIATGCGSDDVIDSAMRAYCEPGERVAFPVPTFGVVSTFAKMNAAVPLPLPMAADFSIEMAALIAAEAAVNYVCTPNNPTGSIVAADQVARLDGELAGLLILDEAYAAFAEADFARFAAESRRTVSLRTFSKAFGLAGLRVGYAVGPAPLILEIEKSRGPYKVGGVAEAAAVQVLSADLAWVADTVERTRRNRQRLAQELNRLPVRTWPSHGNFILLQLPGGRSAVGTNDALREHGIAVRAFPALPHGGECLRVTIGPWPLMQRFLEALKAVLANET